MFSYLPESLVDQARAYFESAALLPSQEEARENFLFLFRLHQDETYTELTTLEELAEHLDAFFFAGLLTGGGGRMRSILQCIELEEDIFAAAPPAGVNGSYGDVHASMPQGMSKLERLPSGEWAVTISIDPNNQEGMPSPLHSLLETLVHELVHSFLLSFLCNCGPCQASRAAVSASTDYRRLFGFEELLGSITRIIREWDKDLAAFYLLEDSANV